MPRDARRSSSRVGAACMPVTSDRLPLHSVLPALEAMAPPALAEAWDNVGLLVGHRAQAIGRVIVCNDWTADTLAEAQAQGPLDDLLVLAYHPPWFAPTQRLLGDGAQATLHATIRGGAAVYSMHTALDAAVGGTGDALAAAAGLVQATPIVPHQAPATRVQLTVMVPHSHVDSVRQALAAAGAGRIGAYSGCSFSWAGEGRFLPEEGATPAIGAVGDVQCAPEQAIQTSWPAGAPQRQAQIMAALHAAHPYETPVYDVVALSGPVRPDIGQGRIGDLPSPQAFAAWLMGLKERVGAPQVLCARPDTGAPVRRVAVAPGAGRSLWRAAKAGRADVLVTGELPHHDALAARAAGLTVVCLLHSVSERLALAPVAARLRAACPGLFVQMAVCDADPYVFA